MFITVYDNDQSKVKNTNINGGEWAYDVNTYLTTGTASSTYAPKASPTFTGNVAIGEAVVKTTLTSFASSSATTIASFPYGEGANAIDCMVLVTGDDIQTVSKLMISSGGEGVFLTEYSIINSGFYESPLTFTVSLSSGNIILQATGGDEYTTTKVYSSQINGESFAS